MSGRDGESKHWADEAAERVRDSGRPPVLSTGISPSGEIHVGNMREVLTADAVYRALRDLGVPSRFHYVCDNFDPLRRVYPFLDRAEYEPRIGRPISEIPCPCGAHPSYADHFLEPFLESLRRLRVEVDVERADRMYKSGRMNACIVAALEGRDRIAEILKEETGREVDPAWSPFLPLCPACGRINASEVGGFSAARETVDYACACGSAGTLPMAGGGKLVWRVDWPARWKALGVTVEPFGKDHATRGGSYDTGVRIVRDVFGGEPPFPIPYEWIRLQGSGDMASSKGNVLSIERALDLVPPEVLRYLVLRERPQRTISFDPGLPLVQLVDEVDDAEHSRTAASALPLPWATRSRPGGTGGRGRSRGRGGSAPSGFPSSIWSSSPRSPGSTCPGPSPSWSAPGTRGPIRMRCGSGWGTLRGGSSGTRPRRCDSGSSRSCRRRRSNSRRGSGGFWARSQTGSARAWTGTTCTR